LRETHQWLLQSSSALLALKKKFYIWMDLHRTLSTQVLFSMPKKKEVS
jgi:hypothetical protein